MNIGILIVLVYIIYMWIHKSSTRMFGIAMFHLGIVIVGMNFLATHMAPIYVRGLD